MSRKIKKELIEWIVIIGVFGIIYLGGWHTEVIGRIQQLVLSTGLISPSYTDEEKVANYDFWIEDMDGTRVNFENFKEEVVFLNFWATWCPPCIAEMPDIQNLYSDQKDNVQFILISLDSDEGKAREFIERKGFDFPVYFLRSDLPQTFNTRSIPTSYLLDKGGQIKVENHGMAKYNTDKFKSLLNELNGRALSD